MCLGRIISDKNICHFAVNANLITGKNVVDVLLMTKNSVGNTLKKNILDALVNVLVNVLEAEAGVEAGVEVVVV